MFRRKGDGREWRAFKKGQTFVKQRAAGTHLGCHLILDGYVCRPPMMP